MSDERSTPPAILDEAAAVTDDLWRKLSAAAERIAVSAAGQGYQVLEGRRFTDVYLRGESPIEGPRRTIAGFETEQLKASPLMFAEVFFDDGDKATPAHVEALLESMRRRLADEMEAEIVRGLSAACSSNQTSLTIEAIEAVLEQIEQLEPIPRPRAALVDWRPEFATVPYRVPLSFGFSVLEPRPNLALLSCVDAGPVPTLEVTRIPRRTKKALEKFGRASARLGRREYARVLRFYRRVL